MMSFDDGIAIKYIPSIKLDEEKIPTRYLYFIFVYLFIIIIWTTGTILCLVHPIFRELALYMIVLLFIIILSPCVAYLFIIFLYRINCSIGKLCR